MVGSYRKTLQGAYNDNGLADMAGNVWEWTSSEYLNYPNKKICMSMCVRRGGSWDFSTYDLRAANRNPNAVDYRVNFIGFRCTRSAP